MKILIVSHSPLATTGYGRVVRGFAASFMAAGHQIVCLGSGNARPGAAVKFPVLPWRQLSVQAIADAIKAHRPDVLLTLGDPWMFANLPAIPERWQVAWMAYYPVDGYPLPVAWTHWAKAVDVPIVFSKFARDTVAKATGKPPVLIYHGVDTKRFCPGDRQKAKELAKVAGHFVVGTVARNQLRKNVPALVKAFARFAKGKDDALLYLHTQLKGEFDIAELVATHGIADKTRITGGIQPDKGVPDELLATVYRAMDVFVLPTMAEGFGLPIMESQACGTPALVTDFSACPELVPDPIQRLKVKDTITMGRNFEQAIVDVDDIVEKLNLLYHDRPQLAALGERCHQFAQPFEWQLMYRQFNGILASPPFQELVRKRQVAAKAAVAKAAGPFSGTVIGPEAFNGQGAAVNGHGAHPGQNGTAMDPVAERHHRAMVKMRSGGPGAAVEAVKELTELLVLRPDSAHLHNDLAVALQTDGRTEDAIKHYRRSVELTPEKHPVWSNLARAYLMAGKTAEARKAATTALRLAPGSAPAHDAMGSVLLKEGDPAQARKAFEKALELMPAFAPARKHLELCDAPRPDHRQDDGSFEPPAQAVDEPLHETNCRQRIDQAVSELTAYPGGFEGRGIVILGGGTRYFPCAWVCIRMLRECGCKLPIELWHLGLEEMTPEMTALVAPYDVRCFDGQAMAEDGGSARLDGWELKPFAIVNSRFREVIYLDADNFPLVAPEFLFDTHQYREHGAVFWPDYGQLPAGDAVWTLTGVSYRPEPAFESGQIVVDKSRCWEPLALTMWFNRNSRFWYRYLHGDKDTFHLAWRKLGRSYAVPERGIANLPHAMAQHDFDDRRIFQHRNRAKWVLDGWNPRMPEFEKEEAGFRFLEELRALWTPPEAKYDLSATRILQSAWKAHKAGGSDPHDGLSASVTTPEAWQAIGRLADHAARCIADSHLLNLARLALDNAPEVAELHAVLGTTLGMMGRCREANEAFLAAEQLCPNLPGLTANIGICRAATMPELGAETVKEPDAAIV